MPDRCSNHVDTPATLGLAVPKRTKRERAMPHYPCMLRACERCERAIGSTPERFQKFPLLRLISTWMRQAVHFLRRTVDVLVMFHVSALARFLHGLVLFLQVPRNSTRRYCYWFAIARGGGMEARFEYVIIYSALVIIKKNRKFTIRLLEARRTQSACFRYPHSQQPPFRF